MTAVPVLWERPDRPFVHVGRVTAKGPLRRHDHLAYKQEFLRTKLADLADRMGGDAIIDVTMTMRGLLKRRRLEARASVIRYTA